MKKELLKIGIRYNAVYIKESKNVNSLVLKESTANLVANLVKLGYTVEENLLLQLNELTPPQLLEFYETFTDVLQLKNNWTPLVKGWDIPTQETRKDHWLTFFANIFTGTKGERLQCGHLIPENTFPLERYNGCPFCGTPFETNGEIYTGQGSSLKVLKLWTESDVQAVLTNLLQSKTALDATQADSLKQLLKHYDLPEVEITMKETKMLVIDALKENGKAEEAGRLFTSPVDVMRYLWYKHTGFMQIIEPKTIAKRKRQNAYHFLQTSAVGIKAESGAKRELKLKYSRSESRVVAKWLNDLPLSPGKSAELMHPKRQMWVRFIRALRLSEFSRQEGMERLRELMDVFYRRDYVVTTGRIESYRLKNDAENTFTLLKERPGLFARSLFANMLWFGKDITLTAFEEVADQIPARLLFTLNSYAEIYFNQDNRRAVKPLGGTVKVINANKFLGLYTKEQLADMVVSVEELVLRSMEERYAAVNNDNKTIYIEPNLFYMPLPIGERSETVQDLPSAVMGARFPVEGNKVRLFMQWGKGLPAQHLDMDLSCTIAYPDRTEICSYMHLNTTGAKHSGDIRSIPHMTGTAEYIEIDIEKLEKAGAGYVSFTCNAYSFGSIVSNLVVGWMNSVHPMKISEYTGVAYDPSCVQHQVRVTQTLSKGLVFGVLDVAKREIVWLEMAFGGQTVMQLDGKGVETMLAKLNAKTTVGNLLTLKARAQQLEIVKDKELADEVYSREWAMDIAGISQLLID